MSSTIASIQTNTNLWTALAMRDFYQALLDARAQRGETPDFLRFSETLVASAEKWDAEFRALVLADPGAALMDPDREVRLEAIKVLNERNKV